MNKLFGLLLMFFIGNFCFAQGISKADLKVLKQKEDSIRTLSVKIIQGINAGDRFTADSSFTKVLVNFFLIHQFYLHHVKGISIFNT